MKELPKCPTKEGKQFNMIMKAKPIDTTSVIMKAMVIDTTGLIPQWIGKYTLSDGHKTGLLI